MLGFNPISSFAISDNSSSIQIAAATGSAAIVELLEIIASSGASSSAGIATISELQDSIVATAGAYSTLGLTAKAGHCLPAKTR